MKGHSIIDIIERSQTRQALREESDLNSLDTPSQVQIALVEDTEVKPSGSEMDGPARRDVRPDRSTAGEGLRYGSSDSVGLDPGNQ